MAELPAVWPQSTARPPTERMPFSAGVPSGEDVKAHRRPKGGAAACLLFISDVVPSQMRLVLPMQMFCVRFPVTQLSLRCWHASVSLRRGDLAGGQQMLPGRAVSCPAGAEVLVRPPHGGDVLHCSM